VSEEKGIYVSFHQHIMGDVFDMFKAAIEVKLANWIQSSEGQLAIERAVKEAVGKTIGSIFSYSMSDSPPYKEFRKFIEAECARHLLRAVKHTKK